MELTSKAKTGRPGLSGWSKGISVASALIAMGFATSSHAATIFQVDPNPSGTSMKIDNAKDQSGTSGTVISPDDVAISVVGNADFANGNATIKPIKNGSLTDLIFTPVSDTAFDGFSFRGQDLAANQMIDVIVTDQANQTQTFVFTVTKANADFAALGIIGLAGETIKSVEIMNTGGFKESKQFAFDAVQPTGAVPEPATWAMMLTGFGGLGVAMRRARRGRALAAI